MERTKCSTHRNRDAIATCVNCGRQYCATCLERIGRGYVCFSCLKKVAKEALRKPSYKPLTLPIIVAAALFLAMALAALAANAAIIAGVVGALAASRPESGLPAYMAKNSLAVKNAAFGIGRALLFGAEAYMLSMNRSFSFWLGILLSIAALYFAITAPSLTREALIFELLLPFVAFVLILVSKRELTG